MQSPVSAAILLAAAGMTALAACAAESSRTAAVAASDRATGVQPGPAAGGVMRRGDSIGMMSEQYTLHTGPYVATGASAWVRPAPAPAFVAPGPLPPADPAPPDPIEEAIRQSQAAAVIARPEAAAPQGAVPRPIASAPDPAMRSAGLALFGNYSCGTCHAFADASGSGSIGPSLDRNPRLTKAFAVDVIRHGSGAMPSFAGQMSDAEIATLADYLVAFARK